MLLRSPSKPVSRWVKDSIAVNDFGVSFRSTCVVLQLLRLSIDFRKLTIRTLEQMFVQSLHTDSSTSAH
jgi:hypothetical protein